MKFNAGISGTRSAVLKDLKDLSKLLGQYELAPWLHREVDLISRNHDVTLENQMYARLEHGQFFSIYEEPIMAFAVKEYTEQDRKVGGVRFNDKTFMFHTHEGQVTLLSNNEPAGSVNIEQGVRIEKDGNEVFIDAESTTGLIPLSVNEEHALSIASEDEFVGVSGRMLHQLKDMDEKESELVLISVAFALANKQI